MNSTRKSEIAFHAKEYTDEFPTESGLADFAKIARSENITLIYDQYNKSFEGLTVCEKGKFYIHLDSDTFPDINSGRARFTIAHELGHALIDDHRLGLLTNDLEPHISEYLLGDQKKEVELEADYFASCLLMPETLFTSKCNSFEDGFSFNVFSYLQDIFKTSLLATILRYADIGPKAVLLTFNRGSNVKWYRKGKYFPDWAFKFNVHGNVPNDTLIHDVFSNGLSHVGEIRKVDKDDWFHVYDDEYGTYDLYEQCHHLPAYDLIVSMLWFEK